MFRIFLLFLKAENPPPTGPKSKKEIAEDEKKSMSAESVSTSEISTVTTSGKTSGNKNTNENENENATTPDKKNNRMSIVLNKTKRFGLLSIEHLI